MTNSSHNKDDVSTVTAVFDAGDDIVNLLIPQYSLAGKINAEAIVAAAAALTGEWGLFSLDMELPESGFIENDEIDQVLFQGEGAVWLFVEKSAVEAGLANIDLPNVSAAFARNASGLGQGPYPPLSVPDRHLPDEWSPHACQRYRGNIAAIAARHNLDGCETVFACAVATAKLIVITADIVDPAITTQLALEMMIGVSRLAPLDMAKIPAVAPAVPPANTISMAGANDNIAGKTELHLVDN